MKKMKKCLSFILAIVLLASSVPLNGFVGLEWPDMQLPEWNLPEIDFSNIFSTTANAATSGTCGKSLTWTLDDEGILTISGTGAMKHYDSGEEVPWYSSRANIKEIIIEAGATNVGSYAFSDCVSLINVTLPDGIKSINYYSFYNCSALESIAIPDTVKIIGSYGFKNCTTLKTVIIGANSNLEAVYEGAFSGCVMLSSITLPSCVEDIEEEVFQDCSSLMSITIPASIRILENSVFQGCSALQSVSFRENSELIKIEKSAFRDCASLTSISLPSSMENIGESAFRNCSALTSIDLPTSISSIGDYAFYECVSLVSITIPSMMTSIKERTFYGCTSLTSITIPDGITIIEYGAFEKCTSLNSVSMPTSVTSVDSAAFMECTTLKTIYVPDTVEYIGMYAFDDTAYYNDQNNWKNGVLYINNHLIKAIDLSGAYSVKDGTKTIASYAFWCPALISINLPDSTEFVNYAAFDGCPLLSSINVSEKNVAFSSADGVLYNKSKTTLLYYSRGKTDSSFIVPKSVTCIGESAFCNCDKLCSIIITENILSIEYAAFMNCTNLRSVIFFKNSKLTSIGQDAFYSCTSLHSISIPSNVTRIESYAFGGCSSLTSVSMLNNVTHIGNAAFYSCYSMTSVAIPETVTFIGTSAFGECSSLTDVYYGGSSEQWKKVAKGSGNWYLTGVENFHYNSNYLPTTEAGNCGENLIYILDDDGILTIFGIGSMDDYSDENPAPWSANSKYIKKVVIEDGVNNIGNYAFAFCTLLTSIVIPDSVLNIGNSAFCFCASLPSIVIPDSVTGIGDSAFYVCTKLAKITVSDANANYCSDVDGVLFNKEKTLLIQYPVGNAKTSYIIPNSVTSIADAAFYNSNSLTLITIPASVNNIGNNAFASCTTLTEIIVSAGNANYSNDEYGVLFNKHKTILIQYPVGNIRMNYEIPNSVTTVENYAFCFCTTLTSITIPDNITSIGDYAFYSCTSLLDTYYASSKDDWEKIIIGRANEKLNESTFHFAKYINAQGLTVELRKTDIVIIPKSNHISEIVTDTLLGVSLANDAVLLTNSKEKPSFVLPFEECSSEIILSKYGFKDYLIPFDVIASWRYIEVEVDNKSTPSYAHTVAMQKKPNDNTPYVSTVFAREGKNGPYSEIQSSTLKIWSGKKYCIIISAGNTGNNTCEYVIEQDASHKISNNTGVFTDVDLFNTLTYGLDCFAYVKRSDGTCSELVKIKFDKQAISLNENVNKFLNGSSLSMMGKDFLKYTIPSDIPLFGDAEISFEAFELPWGFDIDGDSVKISIGANIFKCERENKDSAEYDKWKKECFDDWKELSDLSVDKWVEKFEESYVKKIENFLDKHESGERPSIKSKKQTFNISAIGYVDATIIDGKLVVKEAGLSVEGSFAFKYTQQTAVWVIPAYVYVEAGTSLGGSANGARVVADSEVPFQWEWVLKIAPKLKLGSGAGVKDFASLGIYADANLPIVFNFSDCNIRIDVNGEFGVEAEFCILKGKKSLMNGTTNLLNYYWDYKNERILRLPSYVVNTNVIGDVGTAQNTAQTEIVDRDYLSETSAWLGGTQTVRRVGASARALQQDGLVLTDLQTSVFEKAEPQVVAFGNKLLMTWVEDDATRDELNRMRLMYSIYDGSGWSQSKAVYDDGCNDTTPAIATDGTDVYFVWQKIASVITEETATIEHLVANTEIYTAVYDSESGCITEVTRRTNNNCYDYAQAVAAENGEAVYYWATCEDNQMSTSLDNTIYRNTADNTVAVAENLAYILSIAAEPDEFAYVTDTDNDLTTTDDINVFTVVDGSVVAFDKQGNEVAHNVAAYGSLDSSDVLFVSDGKNIYYESNGDIITILNADTTVNGLQFAEVNGLEYLFWTQNDEIGNVLYAVSYVDNTWTNPVRVSNTQSLLTCIDIEVLDNTLFGVCTSIEVIFNEEDETTETGATNLCWFRINDVQDIAITDIYIDEKNIITGQETDFSVYVLNNGTQTIENLTITVADGLGNEYTVEKQVNLLAGCGDFIDLTYTAPENFTTTTLTVSVDSSDIADGNLDNNSKEKQIGIPQMVLTESELLSIGDKYLVTTMLTNESDICAENVAIFIRQDSASENIYELSVEEIDARKTLFVEFVIDETDLSFDENGIAKVQMTIDDSEEYQGSRIVYIFGKQKETTCAHPVTEVVNTKEPTNETPGYTGDTACAGCGEVLQTGEEIPSIVYTLGDVDGDAQITSSDARTALRAAVGLDELTKNQQKAADADKNGEITSADARLILRAAVGLEILE